MPLRDFLARDFRETETTRLPTRLRDQKINLCHGTVALVSLAPLIIVMDDSYDIAGRHKCNIFDLDFTINTFTNRYVPKSVVQLRMDF